MRLNVKQEDALADVADAKATFDSVVTELKRNLDRQIGYERAGVEAVAKTALDIGVPLRQIGMALGTSDHKTIKEYTEGE